MCAINRQTSELDGAMILGRNRFYLWAAGVVGAVTLLTLALMYGTSSPPLERTEACMLGVLKSTAGVTDAKLGISNAQGWDQPFLEFDAQEKARWGGYTRFYLQKSTDPVHGPFEFMAYLSGLSAPGEGIDIHVSDTVMQEWLAQCGTHANIAFL